MCLEDSFEYLYHYTTVDTLALILDTKRIRFNSLSKVDDLEEVITSNYGKAGKYVYVSCFTNDERESIPIWNMYGGNGSGVRLKIRKNPFIKSNRCSAQINLGGGKVSSTNNHIELIKVIYDDKKVNPEIGESGCISEDFKEVGLYKSKAWEFQKEYRYKKIIFPGNVENIKKNVDVHDTYHDQKIDENILKEIEITLGYNITLGNELIVKKLVDSYNEANGWEIKVKDSSLKNKIR